VRQLRQLTGRGAGRRLALEGLEPGARLTLGRDDACDFVIDEEHISSRHLEVILLDDGARVRDLDSTNGTALVRGDQLVRLDTPDHRELELRQGDLLHLGDPARPVHLAYEAPSTAEDRTQQEILAVKHLTGVAEFESRLRKDPERISVLYEISKRLSAVSDAGDVGKLACQGVFDLLPTATHVVIRLEEQQNGELIHFVGRDKRGAPVGGQLASKSVVDQVRAKRAGVLLADTGAAERPAMSIVRLGIRTVIAAPLWVTDRVTGVIMADNRDGEGVFFETDLEALTVLAGLISLAIENSRLIARLRAAEARLEEENIFLKRQQQARQQHEIIGKSEALEEIFRLIAKVRDTRVPVCLEGETGTGKELVARAIHYRSTRHNKLFVTQNCAALPESILESELFGHVRGAFTGAERDKKGLFEIADGGTIFLDEIGETTPAMQAKLLRVLQEGEVRPVGAVRTKHVDVRVVSATNRNLEEEVAHGRFREDLYYRLKVFPIRLPPLRERREDIPLLARHFLATYCHELHRPVPTFSPEALALLMAYRWPGNVRELQNEMQRIVIQGVEADFVLPRHLSSRLRRGSDLLEHVQPRRGGLKEMLDEVEKWLLLDALREHDNNKTQTAETLQISREGLHKKLARFGLT
jgi:transcriptional regulator with GAF, ATPase, and Fis domain